MPLPPAQAAIKMFGTAFPVVSVWTVKIKGEMWLSVPGFVLKPSIIWRSCSFPRIFSVLSSGLQFQGCSQWHRAEVQDILQDTQWQQPDPKSDVWTPPTTSTIKSHVSSLHFFLSTELPPTARQVRIPWLCLCLVLAFHPAFLQVKIPTFSEQCNTVWK